MSKRNVMKICYLTIAAIALISIVIGSALMIMSPSNRKNVSQTNDNAEENTFETTLPQTEHETQEFAKQLYVLQTPYIGDASADWAILNTIMEYYGITSYESMELHTETEPYGISLHFAEYFRKPWRNAHTFWKSPEPLSLFFLRNSHCGIHQNHASAFPSCNFDAGGCLFYYETRKTFLPRRFPRKAPC